RCTQTRCPEAAHAPSHQAVACRNVRSNRAIALREERDGESVDRISWPHSCIALPRSSRGDDRRAATHLIDQAVVLAKDLTATNAVACPETRRPSGEAGIDEVLAVFVT